MESSAGGAQSLLLYLGLAAILAGNLWFAFLAFKQSLLWGLCVLFIPFVSLIFLVKHWTEARRAWWLTLAGLLLCLIQKALNS